MARPPQQTGRIPQHQIDELLSRVDIVDVISPHVNLVKRGANYSACCPFHNEKTPSFTVSQPKQFYHCFGCGKHGNAIGFLMDYNNMHFVDALEMLAESVGYTLEREGGASAEQRDVTRPLYELLDKVNQYYRAMLEQDPRALKYLQQRGLDAETIERFAIGYAPDGWDTLQQHFPDQDAALLKSGMLSRNERNNTYPRFRDRIMFPIRDRRGRVIAFGGRVIDQGEPKYMNSPETPLFHKGQELYGLFEGRRAMQDADRALVVEGYMDVVALSRQGIHYAVATLGTAANTAHSQALFRIVPEIVFCFDGDNAGQQAAWRALRATLPCLEDGHDARFLFLPEGEDPDSMVRNEGPGAFQQRLDGAMPIIEFLYRKLASDIPDPNSIGGKSRLAEAAKPLLETIPHGIYRQLAFQRLEQLVGIRLGTARARAVRSRKPKQHHSRARSGLSPMRRAIMLALQYPAVVAEVEPEQFDFDAAEPGADLLYRIIGYCDAEPGISTARLIERFRDEPESHAQVQKLAIMSIVPEQQDELEVELAIAEFSFAIEQLRSKRDREADKLPPDQKTGLLGLRR